MAEAGELRPVARAGAPFAEQVAGPQQQLGPGFAPVLVHLDSPVRRRIVAVEDSCTRRRAAAWRSPWRRLENSWIRMSRASKIAAA
jgi:hypothetical protein